MRPNAAATAEHGDAHTEAMQRLSQLQADHAGTEHRHTFGEVVPNANRSSLTTRCSPSA